MALSDHGSLPQPKWYQTKLLVFGSRTFDDWDLLRKTLDRLTRHFIGVLVVNGDAIGADKLAQEWATRRMMDYINFLPFYDKYGKYEAPKERNRDKVRYVGKGGYAVGFPNKDDPCEHVIGLCRKYGLQLKIVRF